MYDLFQVRKPAFLALEFDVNWYMADWCNGVFKNMGQQNYTDYF